ncbi:MAG: universal stress protein [Bacteroidota bacterium]
MLFIVLLNLEDLTNFANTVLLIALILVNAALIIHRKKYPDIERPYRVPLVPLLPFLGILANLYLLIQNLAEPIPFSMAIGALILGMIGFLVWKGSLSDAESIPGEPSRLALGRFATSEKEKRYRILVPISNPATAKPLIDIAAAIAKQHDGEIVALSVYQVPEQTPLSYVQPDFGPQQVLLGNCHQYAEEHSIPLTSVVRVGYNTAKAILEAGSEHHCNMILMGWKGHTTSRQKILGEVTDAVVTHAKRDLLLVKFGKSTEVKNILLPTAGGEHARAAEVFAAELSKSRGGKLTALRIHTDKESISESEEKLKEVQARIQKTSDFEAQALVVDHQVIEQGILEAAESFDTIMVGATRDSIYQQILFGSIPEHIARHSDKTVIVVKHHNPVKALIGQVIAE